MVPACRKIFTQSKKEKTNLCLSNNPLDTVVYTASVISFNRDFSLSARSGDFAVLSITELKICNKHSLFKVASFT